MDAGMMGAIVAGLAGILAHAIASLAPGGSGIPTLIANLTRYLMVAAHGGGLVGGCGTATWVNGVMTSCTPVGNMAWVTIPATLRPLALEAARVLSWLVFPVGS